MNKATTELMRALTKLGPAELRSLLQEAFSRGAYHGERAIEYSNNQGLALTVEYSANANVKSVTAGPYLNKEDISRITGLLDRLQQHNGEYIASLFLFSNRPVRGWWRYKDQWQILPPPQSAPMPSELFGKWPFLLEVKCPSSDDFAIKLLRHHRAINPLRLLLPVLLNGPLFQPLNWQPHMHWVLLNTPSQGVENPLPHYLQEYYWLPDIEAERETFTFLDDELRLDANADIAGYYDPEGRTGDELLEVPELLPELFETYSSLTPVLQQQYLRAAYWFGLGRFLAEYSSSMSFVAYVTAIESLLTKEGPHNCPVCSQNHYPSITKAFRDFLARFVPSRPDRETFYARRSQLTHGLTVLSSDIREEFGSFHPSRINEDEDYRRIGQVCRQALVNWLAAQGPSAPT